MKVQVTMVIQFEEGVSKNKALFIAEDLLEQIEIPNFAEVVEEPRAFLKRK